MVVLRLVDLRHVGEDVEVDVEVDVVDEDEDEDEVDIKIGFQSSSAKNWNSKLVRMLDGLFRVLHQMKQTWDLYCIFPHV